MDNDVANRVPIPALAAAAASLVAVVAYYFHSTSVAAFGSIVVFDSTDLAAGIEVDEVAEKEEAIPSPISDMAEQEIPSLLLLLL